MLAISLEYLHLDGHEIHIFQPNDFHLLGLQGYIRGKAMVLVMFLLIILGFLDHPTFVLTG